MTSPSVTIYRNGDVYFPGVRLVINKKQIRTFDCFLDKVTQGTRSRVAVRNICTPNHGTRLNDLEQLESGGVYVALGKERFKKLEYNDIQNIPANKRYIPQQQTTVRPVIHSRVVVSARCKKAAALEPLSNRIIYVYRNGDIRHPGTKLLLNRRLLCDMEKTLQYITDKVNLRSGAVKGIYTVDGHLIRTCDEIKSGMRYVAVGYGSRFIQIAYSDGGILSLTPQRGIASKYTNGALNNNSGSRKGQNQSLLKRYTAFRSSLEDSIIEQGEKINGKGLEEKMLYHIEKTKKSCDGEQSNSNTDELPVNENQQQALVNIDEDRSGVYKASGEQQIKGKIIQENNRTVIDKPLDMIPAEEVVEEIADKKKDYKKSEDSKSRAKESK